ncbi:potassium channel family protein [Candidatus Mycoplasma haematohominis]|uniref:potassium channel family protein n=1 Tax=Candidatus Mycoplasma haematohominis TaxID=1494318 RepID=UPI001C0A6DBC|nr:TrkA family potassium uptake protein [Candidatus Mycoplasma haemohominis]
MLKLALFDNKKHQKEYCLIGLNKFNLEVGKILTREGHKVTVLDFDKKKIDTYGENFDYAIVCDATNLKELSDIGMESFDYVVLGITDMGTSVITATNLRELGVSNILCKAKDETHRRILQLLGVPITYIPEVEISTKVAYKIIHDLNVDVFSVDSGSKDTLFIKLPVGNKSILGKQISDIDYLRSTTTTIISIKRKDGSVIVPVNGTNVFKEGDIVSIICARSDILQVKDFFNGHSI